MELRKVSNCLVVSLSGEIDHHWALDIKKITDGEFESSNVKNLIFDFSNVDFMDSSGVGLVIGRYKAVSEAGGKMAITGVSGPIDRILDISGIYKITKRCETLDDALRAVE